MSSWTARWLLCGELLGGLAALSLCQLAGCAKERVYRFAEDAGEEEEEDAGEEDAGEEDAGEEDDAGEEEEDAGAVSEPVDEPSSSEPTLRVIMTELFAEYTRDIVARCPCFVSEGIYPSVEECLGRTTRGPEIDDCLDRTVAEDLLQELRDWARCLIDAKREHNACLEGAAACGAQEECRHEGRQCRLPDAVRLKSALDQCPGAIDPAR